jgi:hypothetical protein|tara:strand:- start:107 stop:640 length:534 start_codon:yes stop_codon:yes gene_type:complete
MKEIWIKTFCSPFYKVSNLGNVKSIDRERPWRFGKTQKLKGKARTPRVEPAGYTLFDFMLEDGKKKTIRLHQLVYHSFNDTSPIKGMVVDHIDGDKSNNSLDNLQFISHSDNCAKGKIHTERKHKLPLYIKPSHTSISKGYRVYKKLKGKDKSFGRYATVEEAVKKRDELIKNNWNL